MSLTGNHFSNYTSRVEETPSATWGEILTSPQVGRNGVWLLNASSTADLLIRYVRPGESAPTGPSTRKAADAILSPGESVWHPCDGATRVYASAQPGTAGTIDVTARETA